MQWHGWPLNTHLPTCSNAEFGSSTPNGINTEKNPKYWECWGSTPWDGRRGWLQETCPHAECGSMLKGVTINRGESLKLGSAGALPPWDAVWLTHENKSPPCMCYHFGRSASNKGVGINRRESPKLGSAGARPLGWDAWLTPRNMPLPHVLSCRTWSFCVKGSGYK